MVKTYIIAEAGVNHDGSLNKAKELVDVAVEAEADAVKFQTFKADRLVTASAERADYQKKNIGGKENQYEMLKKLELSFEDFAEIKKYCDRKGIQFLSTPFDEESVKFLVEDLKMERIKIPSGEVVNLPYLRYATSFQRPMILSTGMSDLNEVGRAVEAIREVSPSVSLTLLHCTSNYPCLFAEVNLKAMQTLRNRFGVPVGYSDHTMGIEVAVAAVALGAVVIEKHFTLSRNLPGPDHRCSLEPDELKQMVISVRNVEKALGDGEKQPTLSEIKIKQHIRKSLVLTKDMSAGSVISRQDLTSKRSGVGISPNEIEKLIGLKLRINKKVDETIDWKDVQ